MGNKKKKNNNDASKPIIDPTPHVHQVSSGRPALNGMDDFSNLSVAGDEALKMYPRHQRDEFRSLESMYGITPLDAFERIYGRRDPWQQFDKIAFAFTVTSNIDVAFGARMEFMFPLKYPQVPHQAALIDLRPRQDQILEKEINDILKTVPNQRSYGEEYECVQAVVDAVELKLNTAAEVFRQRLQGKSLAEIREEDEAMLKDHQKAERLRRLEEREAQAMVQEQNLKLALHLEKKRRHGLDSDEVLEEEDPNIELEVSETPIRFRDPIIANNPHTGKKLTFHAVFGVRTLYKQPDKIVKIVHPVKFGRMLDMSFLFKQIYIPIQVAPKEQLESAMDEIRATLEICKNGDHPHLVKVFAYQIDLDEEDPERVEWTILILSEFSPIGPMTKVMYITSGGFAASRVRKYLGELLKALDFLEQMGQIHPALTAQNILFFEDPKGEPIVKLADGYGTTLRELVRESRVRNLTAPVTRTITGFTPPEIMYTNSARTNRTCIWELAMAIIQMAFHQGYNLEHLLTSPEQLLVRDDIDESFIDFLRLAFKANPRSRPSAADVMSHQFLKDEGRMINKPTPENPGAAPHLLRSGFGPAQVTSSKWETKWRKDDKLGQGGFGKVMKARNLVDDQDYAVKILKCETDEDRDAVFREVKLLAKVNHPRVVRYHDTWQEVEITDEEYVAQMKTPKANATKPRVIERTMMDSISQEFEDPSVQRRIGPEYDTEDGEDDGNMFGYQSAPGSSDGDQDFSNSNGLSGDQFDEGSDPFGLQDALPSASRNQRIGFESGSMQSDPFSTGTGTRESQSKAQSQQTRSDKTVEKPQISTLYIQMELCETATLTNLINDGLPYRMEESWKLFRQILEGLEHLHLHGVVHRDLKPANIFIDSRRNIKIGDFGLAITSQAADTSQGERGRSKMLKAGSSSRGVGTRFYTAPELEELGSGEYSSKADMFSLGVIFFQMCMPIDTMTERLNYLRQISENPNFELPAFFQQPGYEKQAKIIKSLINHDQHKRLDAVTLLWSGDLPEVVDQDVVFRYIRNASGQELKSVIDELFAKSGKPSRAQELACLSKGRRSKAQWDPVVVRSINKRIGDVFERRGAVPSNRQHMTPNPGFYNGSARLIDDTGLQMLLPYDLILSFATMLANPEEHDMVGEGEDFTLTPYRKYYCFGTVYRAPTVPGGRATALPEIDYDQISFSARDLSLKDAEVIEVLDAVVTEEPALNDRNLSIYINHGDLLDLILQFCKIPDERMDEIKLALSLIHISSMGWPDVRNKILSSNVSGSSIPESTVSMLTKFHLVGALDDVRPALNQLLDEEYASRAVRPLKRLEEIIRYSKILGVKTNLEISCLSNQAEQLYRGSVMFHCVDVRSKQIVAVGGRYDKLVERYQQPDSPKGLLRVAGFRMNTPLLYDYAHPLYGKKDKNKSKPSTKDENAIPARVDVVVTSFDESTLHGPCIEIAKDLLNNGIKAEVSEHFNNVNELESRYDDPPNYWLVIVRPGQLAKPKVRNPNREETDVGGSVLVTHIRTGLAGKSLVPVVPKLKKQHSTHGESIRKVIIVTPSHKSKKANRTHVVEAASAAASKLADDIDANATVVAFAPSSDEVLQKMRNTCLADGESWRTLKQAAAPNERVYLQQVQEALERLTEEGKEGAFVVNHLTNSCIYYDFGKKLPTER